MKAFALPLSLFLSLSLKADLPPKLSSISCGVVIEKTLKTLKSTDKWIETVNPQLGIFAFRSPTEEMAKWVEIQSFPNPYLFYFEPHKSKVFQWNGKTCAPLINSETKPFSFLRKSDVHSFTDEKLQKLVNDKKNSMIYIWSPTMVYSMSEMATFKKVAKELDLNFVPVLDFNESLDVAKKLISGYKPEIEMQKFQSLELFMREGTIHFPSTYLVGNKNISPRIFGVLTAELLRARVYKELALFNGRIDR